jgi:hypothetical protein
MSDRTIYVYDTVTGKIQYTVDDANVAQIEGFKRKNIPVFVSTKKYKIMGTYVKFNANTGTAMSIEPIKHMDFVTFSKDVLVANGTDEVVVSGLKYGMVVDINSENTYTVDVLTGTTLEISANGFSHESRHNNMIIKFHGYGYHDSKMQIQLIEGE